MCPTMSTCSHQSSQRASLNQAKPPPPSPPPRKDRSIVDDPWTTTTTTIPKYTAHRRARADPTVWSKVCGAGQKAIHRRRKHNHLFLFTFYYHNKRSRSRSRFVSFRQVAAESGVAASSTTTAAQVSLLLPVGEIGSASWSCCRSPFPKPVVVGS